MYTPMQFLINIVISFMAGLCCSHLAKERGRNPRFWFMIGILFSLLGLLALFLLPRRKTQLVEPPRPIAVTPLIPLFPQHTDKLWYYLDEKKNQHGPMSLHLLSQIRRDEKIHDKTFVWNETMDAWQYLNEVMKHP